MFRFSIRELMLVTLVVATGMAWRLDRRAQARGVEEWKNYAACLQELLESNGFDILRGKEWVRATRAIPCMGIEGDQTNVRVGNPDMHPPSTIDPEFVDPYEEKRFVSLPPPKSATNNKR